MLINHLTSGSDGNAIIVDDGYSKLLLDAGVSYSKLAKWIRPSSLSGVLITHEHGDHSKAVPELVRRGVRVYASKGSWEALVSENNIPITVTSTLKHLDQREIGTWIVMPFLVEHDAEEPMGFLFQSKETGKKGVYIADSAYVNYNFSGVTHWILEANYADHILETSEDEEWLKDRIRQSHFSFDDLKKFFRDSDLSQTEEIHLVHLSSRNSDEQLFKNEIQKLTGAPVYTISDSSRKDNGIGPKSQALK
ncbi:MBL fold metallo-hydrolase [Fodinibius sp.]|uniref:MBL fold metallo-hydrolase n=1 Tax=Fodinibius sp. TaxID=1872440 RepID=UPI002ACE2280|nr:MBL fold metallo-hydrolase [Fodinibius sp.]MDZ7658037.1 MBL fold metallo-hydrolase [Fodinibius sp.]